MRYKAIVIKTAWCRHTDKMMGQGRKPRNKLRYLWLIDLPLKCQEQTMGKGQSDGVRETGYPETEVEPLPHTILKNQLKVGTVFKQSS